MDTLAVSPLDAARKFLTLPVSEFVASRSKELGHLAWYAKHIEAYRKANLQHIGHCIYLDNAGAALYGRTQVLAASAALLDGFFANPHTSVETGKLVTQVRCEVLKLFGASDSTHILIFTSGATHGLQLLGESYAWSSRGVFLYAQESHTSVLGLRQYAQRAGTACGTFKVDDLSLLSNNLVAARPLEGGSQCPSRWHTDGVAMSSGQNIIAVPGESNFSGVRSNLDCIDALRTGPMKWRVLLDAAKLACSPGSLNLSQCGADFAVISFYKIFGYPTGLGALIVRQDAVPLLAPRGTLGNTGPSSPAGPAYFGGGSVSAVSATSSFAVPRPVLSDWLERGTSHFLGIAALPSQIAAMRELGTDDVRRRHVLAVCREAYLRMTELQHATGQKLCTIFGRHADSNWQDTQGPTIACIFHFPDGSPVPYGIVDERAKARNIILRTGCLCNAGACQQYLDITDGDIRHYFAAGKVCGDNLGIIDGRPVGVVRISFGVYSTLSDVAEWVALLRDDFLDCQSETLIKITSPVPTCKQNGSLPEKRSLLSSKNMVSMHVDNIEPDSVPAPITEKRLDLQNSSRRPFGTARAAAGEIVALKVYPIKGCGALRVRHWPLDISSGALFLDRRWCIAPNGRLGKSQRLRPVSAKQAPQLTQVKLSLAFLPNNDNLHCKPSRMGLVLSKKGNAPKLVLPLSKHDEDMLRHSLVETEIVPTLHGHEYVTASFSSESRGHAAAQWFESLLGISNLTLVEAGVSAGTGEVPSQASAHFANAPSTLLLVSTASLHEFGRVCGLAVPAERFRANIEVAFEIPFAEDEWVVGDVVSVDGVEFEAAGRCVRCQAVDVDPDTGAAEGPSLLAALATSQQGASKGPTFGVLLRLRPEHDRPDAKLPIVVSVGMQVHAPNG